MYLIKITVALVVTVKHLIMSLIVGVAVFIQGNGRYLTVSPRRKRECDLQAVLPDSDDSGGCYLHGGTAVHEDHFIRRPVLLHHGGVHHRGH